MAGRVVATHAAWEARSFRMLRGMLLEPEVTVGLYVTQEEAQRVVDLLRLKAAIDNGHPLQAVPLHLPLEEYTGNSSTMQYLRDNDVDAVWATFRACSAEPPAEEWEESPLESPAAAAAAPANWWEQEAAEGQPAEEGGEAEGAAEQLQQDLGSMEEEAAQQHDGSDAGDGGGCGEEGGGSGEEEGASSDDSSSEWEEDAPPAKQQAGTGRLNAAGRPLRVAATVRKQPLPAPGEAEVGGSFATQPAPPRPRKPTPAAATPKRPAAPQAAAAAEDACASAGGAGRAASPTSRRPAKSIIFPPVPASMRCLKCVNCQNPQRKRPCVLARRRLLDLLRQQEAEMGLAEAAEARDGGGDGCGDGDQGTQHRGRQPSPAATDAGTPRSAAALAAALHLPPRKQLYPPIPPSERCGQCKPCLNPRLKKACREARKRQLEAGLAPLAAQPSRAPRGGGTVKPRSGQARAESAVAAGRRLGESVVGCRLRIYWPGMRRWYEGAVSSYDAASGQHQVDYDDGDQQQHLLGEEKLVLLDPPAPAPAGQLDALAGAAEAEGEQEEEEEEGSGEEEEEEEAPEEDPGREEGHSPPAAKRVRLHPSASPDASGRAGGEGRGGTVAPVTPAGAAGTGLLLAAAGSPATPPPSAAPPAVARLPAALAACCRCASGGRAAAAGISSGLVGRFMAAFSCAMSEGQRQEHAAFLLPLLEAECFEGVQACMAEVVQLCCGQAGAATSTGGPVPAAPACPSQQDPAAESRHREPTQQQGQEDRSRHSLPVHPKATQPALDAVADGSAGGLPALPSGLRSSELAGCDHLWQGAGLSSSGSGSRTDPLGVPRPHGAAAAVPAEACRGDGGTVEGTAAFALEHPEEAAPLAVLAAG